MKKECECEYFEAQVTQLVNKREGMALYGHIQIHTMPLQMQRSSASGGYMPLPTMTHINNTLSTQTIFSAMPLKVCSGVRS
jgi:hypothetical protein